MSPEQFVYWLQGFAELCGGDRPTQAQWQSIHQHLATVFHKVTPPLRTGEIAAGASDGSAPTFEQIAERLRHEHEQARKQASPLGWPARAEGYPGIITC
jgi:hypothetical protein